MRLRDRAVSHTPQATLPSVEKRETVPLHSHLLKWIEHKINKNVVKNPFDALERQARRRQFLANSKMLPEKPREKDTLLESLRLEHKVNPSGLNILHLPKRPFGCHSTYNGEEQFVKQHLVSRDSSPAQLEQLDSLVRLFRLVEKRQQRKSKYSPPARKATAMASYDTYESKNGLLYCLQHKRFLQAYENDRVMYKEMMEQAFKLTKEQRASEPRHARNRSLASPTRLYPKPPGRSSRLSESLSHKYSKLFEGVGEPPSFEL